LGIGRQTPWSEGPARKRKAEGITDGESPEKYEGAGAIGKKGLPLGERNANDRKGRPGAFGFREVCLKGRKAANRNFTGP
jgi:hypothetical protein